ncbi:MAG: PAS domain-containing sensor histidine kinase [Cyclobacteriaceae bacterium]|nr:PAS domain-containing sensor histidine kinase [Cyclobacteriaceae bacterium]
MAKQLDEKRLNEFIEMISLMSQFDFTHHVETNISDDPIDKIAYGLNELSEKLKNNVVEKSLLTQKYKKLNESLSDYKYALDQSAIVVITDTKGNVEYVNDMYCKISKYSEQELIGQNQRIINSGYHQKKFWKQMWSNIGKGRVWRSDVRNKAKDGSFYWIDSTIVPFLNSKGNPVRYLAVCHDISDRMKKEQDLIYYQQKLEQTNENLEKFARIAAHDMKSPMNAASGLIHLLEAELGENKNKEVAEYLQRLNDTFHSTKQLINGILNYSKTSLTEIEMEEVDLSELICNIVDRYSLNKQVVIHFDKVELNIKHNKTVLTQIFDNILNNAVKYNDKEICEIELVLLEKNDHYEISISDNGPGIANEDREIIFDLFENLKTTNKDSTGIGLATVKNLLSETNGQIWVETSEKKGAKFVITIKK